RMRTARLGQIAAESQNWQRRRDGAKSQMETLSTRSAEIAAQLEASNAAPDSFAERREALDREIESARLAHKDAADRLAEAQTRYREADKAQRLAAEALSGVREQMG